MLIGLLILVLVPTLIKIVNGHWTVGIGLAVLLGRVEYEYPGDRRFAHRDAEIRPRAGGGRR